MNKTNIEWCDYTINPVKGLCPVGCSYCYARAMYKRFKWNPEIRLQPYWWDGLTELKPSRIFVGSTMELFGDWVKPEWLTQIFGMCAAYKKHTFIFLTKQPQNLLKWSPFPENCWTGFTATNEESWLYGIDKMRYVKAKVKFVSFEPLLEAIDLIRFIYDVPLDWLIIGQQTPISAKTQPKIEWIQEIVEAADKAGIPVFLKDNSENLLPRDGFIVPMNKTFYNQGTRKLRQEFPHAKTEVRT
jgi:protein gp37